MHPLAGTNLSLTRSRRLVCDMMDFSRRVPTVIAERVMQLGPLLRARNALASRPYWYAILARAFALVSRDEPRLRRCYRPFPWPHLHEHPVSAVTMPVSRAVDGEEGMLFLNIVQPEEKPLAELHARIHHAKTAPVDEVRDFRTQLRLALLPWFVRRLMWWLVADVFSVWRLKYFGTFGVTGVSSGGSDTPYFLSPLTSTVTMGVLAPDGSVPVRLLYDHRVFDAEVAGRALARLEEVLCGQVTEELRGMAEQPPVAGRLAG